MRQRAEEKGGVM